MTTKSDIQAIAIWVRKVRKQTSAGKEDVDGESMETVTEWLAQDFPVNLFNDESAKRIAECANGYWPKWGIMKAALTDFQADVASRSTQKRIGTDIPDSLRERIEELQDGRAYFANAAEQRSKAKADWSDPAKIRQSLSGIGVDHPMRGTLGKMLVGLVRKHAPQNIDYLPPEFLG